MSLSRAALVCFQAVLYQLASTPPNKAPQKLRYATSDVWFSGIAPFIFSLQQPLVWMSTLADVLLVLAQQTLYPLPASLTALITAALCPRTPAAPPPPPVPAITLTPLFLLGVALVLAGTALRLTCYRCLGPLFTFDLAIMPAHRLVTHGPYALVRHPAYAGSLAIMAGLGCAHLTSGGWLVECGVLPGGAPVRALGFALWYAWWLGVGVRRARAEDAALQTLFGAEWERYARDVRWWFFPGVL